MTARLDVGPTGPIGVPRQPALWRRMQGLEPETGGLRQPVWCVKSHAMPSPLELLGQPFLADPTHSRWRPQHPDSRHKEKPGWVESQVARWDGGKNKSCQSISTVVQGQGGLGRGAALGDHSEVGMCRKLCDDGRITDAVDALNLLVERGCHVDNNLFYRLLQSCMAHKDLVLGRRIHALTVKSGYEGDAFLATHLIGLYASHGRLEQAMGVFTKVSTPSAYNWATIIFAHARHGEAAQAIQLYRRMREWSSVKPTNRIFVAVLKACAAAPDLVAGREVHAHILSGAGEPDHFVQTGLVDMYAKCRSLEAARSVFDKLGFRDVVAWTAMIAGYAQQGMGEEALALYTSMQEEGSTPPNSVTFACLLQACASVGQGAVHQGKQLHAQIERRGLQDGVVVGTSLIRMYAKCGSLKDARSMFDRLADRNVVTWTTLIAGYAQQGMGQEALSLYSSMQQEGVTTPNCVTFVCLLQACASVSALPLGKQLHAQIEEGGLEGDPGVGAALVNMYAKCGSMLDCQHVFDSLPERSTEAWNSLISGYTRRGDGELVCDLVLRMRLEGIQPDAITFLSLLTVCSHVGLVDKGRHFFEAMSTEYGISPCVEHYTCMMDLLGRAGELDEALRMANTMPFPPDRAVWLTLLSACRKWNNVEKGQQAFESAVSVDGKDAASYVLMSNIYASAQMWEAVKETQARRAKCGAWKEEPGQSWWTDAGGVVHTYQVAEACNALQPDRDLGFRDPHALSARSPSTLPETCPLLNLCG